jgi:hypothetical protein
MRSGFRHPHAPHEDRLRHQRSSGANGALQRPAPQAVVILQCSSLRGPWRPGRGEGGHELIVDHLKRQPDAQQPGSTTGRAAPQLAAHSDDAAAYEDWKTACVAELERLRAERETRSPRINWSRALRRLPHPTARLPVAR